VKGNGPVGPESDSGVADRASKGRVWILVVVLLVVPGALYAAVPVAAFLLLTTAQKIGVSSALVVAAEAVSRYRRFLDPRAWFRKR
jgi:hypothetical protein